MAYEGKAITLLDILEAVGRDAVLERRWFPSDVEAAGTTELASELQHLSDTREEVEGRRLLDFASGRVQIVDGLLRGANDAGYSIEIWAIDSTHWDVASDEQLLQGFTRTFPNAEVVDE
jgi:hypothetical protein